MNLSTWYYTGIFILILDILAIVFYYNYATVKVYNFLEKEKYHYLGSLWIEKKNGCYYLKIPPKMIEKSVTTKYKITSESCFHQFKKWKKMYVIFSNDYEIEVELKAKMIVKNYIRVSHQL